MRDFHSLRFKYYYAFRALIMEVIEDGVPRDDSAELRRRVERIASPGDVDELLSLLVLELRCLHDGNSARFRLRLAEFREWVARQA